MRRGLRFLGLLCSLLWYLTAVLSSASAYAQSDVPTPDQLDTLLAPVALYPDALVAQICTAATDPQQILDANTWLKQNANLTGQALTDAAQAKGFDPAFIALTSFPQVLDMMAQNIDSYAAIGRAFSANQGTVMDSIQRLRQQAYAAGNLQSNQYQQVEVQNQDGVQAVTIVPANPQIVYVPVYNPQVVYVAAPPDPAVPIITFGVGIALGVWIAGNSSPWGWGGWGWGWGHHTVIVHNTYWGGHNHYRPPYPTYRPRPPHYGPPIHARPPNNWYDRPNYPGGRPPGGGPPGGKPPPGSGGPGGRPPGGGPPPGGGSGGKPPGGGGKPPGGGTPPGGGGGKPPGGGTPPGGGGSGGRPPGGGSGNGTPSRPPGTPTTRPAPTTPAARPATPNTARPQTRPSPQPYAGYPSKSAAPNNTGARPSAFGGSHNASADRAASSRGHASVSSQQRQRPAGGQRR